MNISVPRMKKTQLLTRNTMQINTNTIPDQHKYYANITMAHNDIQFVDTDISVSVSKYQFNPNLYINIIYLGGCLYRLY